MLIGYPPLAQGSYPFHVSCQPTTPGAAGIGLFPGVRRETVLQTMIGVLVSHREATIWVYDVRLPSSRRPPCPVHVAAGTPPTSPTRSGPCWNPYSRLPRGEVARRSGPPSAWPTPSSTC